jgi:hypothetical protein
VVTEFAFWEDASSLEEAEFIEETDVVWKES